MDSFLDSLKFYVNRKIMAEDKGEKCVFTGRTYGEMAVFCRKNIRKNIEKVLDFLFAIL